MYAHSCVMCSSRSFPKSHQPCLIFPSLIHMHCTMHTNTATTPVHGLGGTPEDLSYLKEALERNGGPGTLVHLARCNKNKTRDGVAEGGTRLANEVNHRRQMYVPSSLLLLKCVGMKGNSAKRPMKRCRHSQEEAEVAARTRTTTTCGFRFSVPNRTLRAIRCMLLGINEPFIQE